VEPRRDIEIVEAELILKDLDTIERRLQEGHRQARSGDKKARVDVEYCERLKTHLHTGGLASSCHPATPEEHTVMQEMHLLTSKPVMFVCNVDEAESEEGNAAVGTVMELARLRGARVVTISAEIEAEVAMLESAERKAFLEEYGLTEPGLERVVREGYALLDLITFFTASAKEVHAWTVRRGTTASHAAGVIHSDFERGFIRAEVMQCDQLSAQGSEHAMREQGVCRAGPGCPVHPLQRLIAESQPFARVGGHPFRCPGGFPHDAHVCFLHPGERENAIPDVLRNHAAHAATRRREGHLHAHPCVKNLHFIDKPEVNHVYRNFRIVAFPQRGVDFVLSDCFGLLIIHDRSSSSFGSKIRFAGRLSKRTRTLLSCGQLAA